jgi:hypothetical protein
MRGGKRVDELSGEDLDEFPVWSFVNDDADELLLRPVKRLPVPNLSGAIVGTWVVLANRTRVRATLGNVDVKNPRATQHFLQLSVARERQWFHLARYFDFDYSERGPAGLAQFLDLDVSEVFPIAYDVRSHVQGAPAAAAGIVHLDPIEKLSRDELVAMAVP